MFLIGPEVKNKTPPMAGFCFYFGTRRSSKYLNYMAPEVGLDSFSNLLNLREFPWFAKSTFTQIVTHRNEAVFSDLACCDCVIVTSFDRLRARLPF